MTTSCVVTGGARGIGRGIAERMVAQGHQVVVTDIDAEGAVRTAAEIGAAEGLGQDVRDPASHREVAAAAARHGVLTAWFNNAGIGNDGTLAELTDDAIRSLVEVNLLGVLWGTRAALDAFGDAGGDVVTTASMSAHGPVPGLSTYAATKAAVVSLAMSVHAETPANVRIHALCPDGVDTQMVVDMSDTGLAKALVHSGGRLLTVDEVADEAVALLGGTRVVRSLPGRRAAIMRVTTMAPHLSAKAVGVFAAQGRRRMKRR